MYKAFLSYAQLKEYLALLEESELLAYDNREHTFKTTQKGLRFLNITNSLQGLMDGLQTTQGLY